MKYTSYNRFCDFEFHDSVLTLVNWLKIGNIEKVVVSAKHLNVHKDAAPNNSGVDMEISEAIISFHGFTISEFESGGGLIIDENGNRYTEPVIIYKGDEAREMLEKELRNSVDVLSLSEIDNGEYELEAIGIINHYFSVRFNSKSVDIEWSDYEKLAWYELNKQFNKSITLSTPRGDVYHKATIIYKNVCSNEPNISIGIDYEGQYYFGVGKDYLWCDAFADLQKKLPDGVLLKCCMTCRHGNMCPVGNTPNELFCTKDIEIKEKSDLFFYTEDTEERLKRVRSYTDICDKYQQQSFEYYTYNDYLHYLSKK